MDSPSGKRYVDRSYKMRPSNTADSNVQKFVDVFRSKYRKQRKPVVMTGIGILGAVNTYILYFFLTGGSLKPPTES